MSYSSILIVFIFLINKLQETSPERVVFQYNNLNAGTYVIDFQATAASVGNWILPPVEAYVDQQPEVMGLSAASSFKVNFSFLDKLIKDFI